VVICLERGADLHMAQLTPLPLTVSCFSKIQISLPFWYQLACVVPEKGPLNGCVCVCVCVVLTLNDDADVRARVAGVVARRACVNSRLVASDRRHLQHAPRRLVTSHRRITVVQLLQQHRSPSRP